jgi:hypothetical protein
MDSFVHVVLYWVSSLNLSSLRLGVDADVEVGWCLQVYFCELFLLPLNSVELM